MPLEHVKLCVVERVQRLSQINTQLTITDPYTGISDISPVLRIHMDNQLCGIIRRGKHTEHVIWRCILSKPI